MSIASNSKDGPGTNGFEDIYLIHNSVPELDIEDIDLKTEFLGKSSAYPIMINALTGGTDQAKRINRALAQVAEKYGLVMAVGSQKVAIEDPGLRDSFTVVRESNPGGIILANIGANSSVEDAMQAVNMIEADGLQLHFNIPQELAMAEGDRHFRGLVDNVRDIVDKCPVPVIAKEVGFGFSRETVNKLHQTGVNIFDSGGMGGTNFLSIEDQRGGMFEQQLLDWGIPTAISLAEITSLKLPIYIVATGGIRTAHDAAKALAMGANMVGITGLFLKILLNSGLEELDKKVDRLLYQLKSIFLMTGSSNRQELQSKPVLILGKSREWLIARGIDPARWSS